MNIFEYFQLLPSDYTLRSITLGTAALGAICGMLGSFAVLKNQSLLGDAISHAALPGIAIAFLLTQTKDNNMLLIGALISGLLGTLWVGGIVKKTHLKTDAALGIVLSVFFGFGMLLLTYIQHQPNANQAGLDKYLFGQAATLVFEDVKVLLYVLGVSLFVLLLFWKEFKVMLFDPDYTQTLGFNVRFLDLLTTFFIVLAIVLGLQTVGVVLMSAMLLAPAAAARQWTNNLGKMLFIAAFFGILAGIMGTAISATQSNMATGPVIVIIAVVLVLLSFVFSPSRGLLSRQIRFIKNRKQFALDKTLGLMYSIAKDHPKISHPHNLKLLNDFKGYGPKTLKKLTDNGWVEIENDQWWLTEKGFEQAQKINHLKNNEA